MVRDSKAEALEAAGLFRRAAARWLELFSVCGVKEQEWVVRRRNECLARVKQKVIKKDNFSDIGRAASALQKKMGIDRPCGQAFRLPASGRGKEKQE